MLIGWKSDLLDIKAVEYGSFSITTQFTTKIDGLFGGYPVPTGPPQEMEKKGILVGIK